MDRQDSAVDLLVIGGGINGAGIARDAAGRGLSVILCEQADLASATSSSSSKLIHGGLRYLEQYEFRLVREALAEREVLLRIAPHIIWPMRFVLPHNRLLRPAWMIRLGLFLYDHIGGRRSLPGTRSLDFRTDRAEGAPLKPELARGFAYSDCWVEDSRLVVLNAMDARARGAEILPRTRCVEARREGGRWTARLKDLATGAERVVTARILVNAAGPWVERFLHGIAGQKGNAHMRLVKGSHIVVPRLYEGDHAYILQNTDRRVIFAIPYEHRFTLIGTTDIPFQGDASDVRIDPEETAYLCDAVNRYFRTEIGPQDVVRSYSGVRPLYDDDSAANPSTVTRDYVFDLSGGTGEAPLLSIYGGKITTYRRLAEHAMDKLAGFIPGLAPSWTAKAPLPGGDMPDARFEPFAAAFKARRPWLPAAVAQRLCRLYGTMAEGIVGDAASLQDMGTDFGGGLYEREAAWLVDREWARTADDILWRRTKLGLHVPAEGAERLAHWLAQRLAGSKSLAAAS
ncbi:glycerol-3-phosphate dehydrogenase [Skermanella rosea]|uniref:glycerol-3-phosphate dehydrogenase n=1 Tax=Skermanella rosea TaxID=1817965 RepID=UPI001E5DD486|nr:glycerol-3-phosphate dehydrogenase [Skermanella rosea]UEM05728.1 glycerol-3-phosphate dehydrogenase [Skermanella rosea]